jgi:outer membrane protein OmpA-like peptidoglycan-associated protein
MRGWLLGAAAVALLAPAAQAQTGDTMAQPAASAGEVAKGHYLVFFDWNRATLNAAGRVVVAEAVADFQRSGQAQVEVVGHTDTSGSSAYNQKLSLRRADAVRAELERLGVPAAAIVTSGRGQDDLLVPTADHAREPQNRRVEIIVRQPPPQAPVAATPEQPPPPPPPVASPPSLAAFSLGLLYGHNFGETDRGNSKTQNDLLGPELRLRLFPDDAMGVTLKQALLQSFNGVDNGANGRSGISVDLTPEALGQFSPYVSANFGGIYGPGVQDGLLAGPELGLSYKVSDAVAFDGKVAYDYQFRNQDWNKGIVWGGLRLRYHF